MIAPRVALIVADLATKGLVPEGQAGQSEVTRYQRAYDRGECPECKAEGTFNLRTACTKHAVILKG